MKVPPVCLGSMVIACGTLRKYITKPFLQVSAPECTKTQLSISCQQNIRLKVLCHPVKEWE